MFLRRNAPTDEDVLGSYFSHEFCIELAHDKRLVDAAGRPIDPLPAETLAVFGHEYFHYLQNISTVSGFAGYHATQQLLAIFSKTIDRSGRSRGSVALEDDDQRRVAEIVDYLDAVEGEGAPEAIDDPDEVASLVSVREPELHQRVLPMGGGDVTLSELVVTCSVRMVDGAQRDVDYRLGILAIEEGMAFEIDRILAGVDGAVVDQDAAPPFPYFALRRLAEHLNPGGVERAAVIACAVLALLANDAARALHDGLRDLGQRRQRGEPLQDALRAVEEALRPHREGCIRTILQDIEGLKAMHAGRGLSDTAMARAGQLFGTLLTRRLRDPFWDVRPFSRNDVDNGQLTRLLRTAEPCLVIQRNPDDQTQPADADRPLHDWLLASGAGGDEEKAFARNALPVLQCQVHYVRAHLEGDVLVPSGQVPEDDATCPFYRACSLQLRRDHPDVCKRSPWRILEQSPDETCWYGAAVAGTLGEVKLAPDVAHLG